MHPSLILPHRPGNPGRLALDCRYGVKDDKAVGGHRDDLRGMGSADCLGRQ